MLGLGAELQPAGQVGDVVSQLSSLAGSCENVGYHGDGLPSHRYKDQSPLTLGAGSVPFDTRKLPLCVPLLISFFQLNSLCALLPFVCLQMI